IQWHLLDFESAVKSYLSVQSKHPERIRATHANLAFLWGVYGIELDIEPYQGSDKFKVEGFAAMVDSYYQFSWGMGKPSVGNALEGAARFLVMTSKQGMERYYCVALDAVAMALALAENLESSAA